MHIENWPTDNVRPYPNNPRVLRNAAEKVAESIKAFGWRQPIVVDEAGVIIVGHSRLAAAKLLKLESVPVHVAKGLTDDQVRAYRLSDNKTATFADWDEAKLADELAEIMGSIGSVTITGFSQSEFDAIEMRARAEIDRISRMSMPESAPTAPTAGVPAAQPQAEQVEEDDFDLPENDQPEAEPATAPTNDALVPFNVLMPVAARQVVYDAIAKAKQAHGFTHAADALRTICEEYANA